MALGALGLPSHPAGEEGEEGVVGILPAPARVAALGQSRRHSTVPQLPQHTYLLTLGARHTTVSLQSKAEEGFREPSSLYITLPPPHALPQTSS